MPPDEKPERPATAAVQFALLTKGDRVVLVRVPALEHLVGMAEGAKHEGDRDREDRY